MDNNKIVRLSPHASVNSGATAPPLVRMLKSGSDNLHAAAEAALEVLTMDPQTREQLFDSIQEALPVS